MKAFDFYEFTGVLVPGAITIVAVLLLFPQSCTTFFPPDLTVGDLGLFVVLAYAGGCAGYLVHPFEKLVVFSKNGCAK